MPVATDGTLRCQLIRYLINGVLATLVHYSVLRFNIEVLQISLAAIANAIAAMFGITASFIGSRYFVFRGQRNSVLKQGSLFLLVYATIAVLHALVMFVWSDWLAHDYRVGFLLATGMQIAFSFFANKFLVFK